MIHTVGSVADFSQIAPLTVPLPPLVEAVHRFRSSAVSAFDDDAAAAVDGDLSARSNSRRENFVERTKRQCSNVAELLPPTACGIERGFVALLA